MQKIIRVGVMNNFNFSEEEIKALEPYKSKGKLFVNSNSFVTITPDYPSIITINPYLKFVEPQGILSNIKACRVKVYYNFGSEIENAIRWSITHNIPVLITFQRWIKIISALSVISERELRTAYYRSNGYFRLKPEYQKIMQTEIKEFAETIFKGASKLIYFCDAEHKGCLVCKNCIRLTYGKTAVKNSEVYSLNLDTVNNGKCLFHCPDCFVKKLLRGGTPRCNILHKNDKQKGYLKTNNTKEVKM